MQQAQVSEENLREILPALAQAIPPHLYGHFWAGDDLCVIPADKDFLARASDRTTWRDFIADDDSVGVDRKWTENVPTELPAWVKRALQR